LEDTYPILNFYCCWAVHPNAKGLGADRILKRLDEAYPLFENARNVPIPNDIIQAIGDTISLVRFRADLASFLSATYLPADVTTDKNRWLGFLDKYSAITEDCPFVLSGNSNIALQNIKSVTVKKCEGEAGMVLEPGERLWLQTRWEILAKDGKTGLFTMNF